MRWTNLAILSALLASNVGVAADHQNKPVGTLESANAGTDCLFFKLDGVAQADSSVTGPDPS